MEEKIRGILEDIYRIDPSLKDREDDLVNVLSEILESKPDMEPDQQFVQSLRERLVEKVQGMPVARFGKSVGSVLGIYRKIFLPASGLTAIALVAAILIWGVGSGFNSSLIKKDKAGGISSKVAVSKIGNNAFGVLSSLSTNSNATESDSRSSLSSAEQAAKLAAPAGQGGGVGAAGSMGTDMVVPYEPVYYTYVYKGEDFTQPEAKLSVLKRITDDSAVLASSIYQGFSFNLFNLGKLGGAKTSNISFFENKNFGYRTDIDLIRGSASIYKNWDKWPDIYADCKDPDCYNRSALKTSDMPSDEDIIASCNDFLKNYDVDMSAYGAGLVNKDFLRYYAQADSIRVPDEVSIIYPLQIDGKGVYEGYGEMTGLNVSYDLRNKKVSSVYNLTTHSYQSSDYDAETEIAKILDIAQKADGAMPLKEDGNTNFKTVELQLDTPVLSYENFWKYENGQNSEYLVPALVFPIKDNPDAGNYYRKRVVVPLIKDFLNQNDGGPMRAMDSVKAG